MANELNVITGVGSQTITASLILGGVVAYTGISIPFVAGSVGVYSGSMPGGAPSGYYSIEYFLSGAYLGGDEIMWDGTEEISLLNMPTSSQNATATLTAVMTESYATDGSQPTLAQCLYLIQQSLHEFAIAGTSRTVKKLDGATTAAVFTLDSSSLPTSTTRSS